MDDISAYDDIDLDDVDVPSLRRAEREYAGDLRFRMQREAENDAREQFQEHMEDAVANGNWKLDYKIGPEGVEIWEGDKRLAIVFDPMAADRIREILTTHSQIADIALISLDVIAKIQRMAFSGSPEFKQSIKFITDSNFQMDLLKRQKENGASVRYENSLDTPESKV